MMRRNQEFANPSEKELQNLKKTSMLSMPVTLGTVIKKLKFWIPLVNIGNVVTLRFCLKTLLFKYQPLFY